MELPIDDLRPVCMAGKVLLVLIVDRDGTFGFGGVNTISVILISDS